VFAAPGAVFISGPMTKKDYGKISAAGPFTNILLSAVFLVVYLLSPESIIGTIAMIGASLNSWIALFNMIPFGNFDGLKIWRWSRAVYFSMVIVSFGLMIATMGI
jgi:Zn-dependent protease